MSKLNRFGVSMDTELLCQFDSLVEERGYTSRSEAIRDLIRDELVDKQWQEPSAEVVGTITIVYEHHEHELSHVLAELQHRYHECIVCSTHVHLDPDNCLEVIIVKGTSARVRRISDAISSTLGVKHSKLVCSTTGADLH